MKPMPSLLILLSLLGLSPLLAQVDAAKPADAANPGSTVITADVFRLDMSKKQGVFTTDVLVEAQDFKLHADELTVFFAAGSGEKIERILARGNVVIEQPERTAKSNQAEYFVSEDRMVLTGLPDILQKNGNHISGTTISIYRSSNRMDVDGRSKLTLFNDLSSGSSTTTPPATK